MGRNAISKLQLFDAQHPGVFRQVDAMFEAFIPLRTISAALQAQYGERISHTSIWNYRRQAWSVRRVRIEERRAAQVEARGSGHRAI